MNDTILDSLDPEQCENVFIFICDSLRWDALPPRVEKRGKTIKTVASGLMTPQSIPSILTGVYPPRHGATWFHESMDDSLETIFSIDGFNERVFSQEEWGRHPLDDVLNNPPSGTVDSLESPFIHIEHDSGGHAPYESTSTETSTESFAELSRQPDQLRAAYEQNVAMSVDRFEQRLDQLAAKGVLNETLVIFISDHGEHLDDHGGFVSHGYPPSPELVYVPTVFIHPSIDAGTCEQFAASHVDILPTLWDVFAERSENDSNQCDGQSLCRPVELDRPMFTSGVLPLPQSSKLKKTAMDPIYDAPSVWTAEGGYVFSRSKLPKRVLTGIYESVRSGNTAAYNSERNVLSTLVNILPVFLEKNTTYGDPAIDQNEANEFCNEVLSQEIVADQQMLTEETKKALADLGYR